MHNMILINNIIYLFTEIIYIDKNTYNAILFLRFSRTVNVTIFEKYTGKLCAISKHEKVLFTLRS